jgi:hypothetical protein
MITKLEAMSPAQRREALKTIRSKRARARRLSADLAQHEEKSNERAEIWRELRDEYDVDVKTLAADSGVTPMAVRKALNTRAAG